MRGMLSTQRGATITAIGQTNDSKLNSPISRMRVVDIRGTRKYKILFKRRRRFIMIAILRLSRGEVSFTGGFLYSPSKLLSWLRHPLTTTATQLCTGLSFLSLSRFLFENILLSTYRQVSRPCVFQFPFTLLFSLHVLTIFVVSCFPFSDYSSISFTCLLIFYWWSEI